jgi:ATP-dependent DNA helicase RecQ
LLPTPADRDIWHYFATASMPEERSARAVIDALAETAAPLSTAALETIVDVRRTRLELLLKVLDVEGAVSHVRGGWTGTGEPWTYDADRYRRVADARRREQGLMLDYIDGGGCRMAFLQRTLDDPYPRDCGRCDRCAGAWFASDVAEASVDSARDELARVGVALPARNLWPTGMARLGVGFSGRIGEGERAETGRTLARFTDLGLGQRLRDLLSAPDQPVPDWVLPYCFQVLREWDWAVRPSAVVAVPSQRRPELVASVAAELARRGRLTDLGSLALDPAAEPVEPAANSAYRLAQVADRFALTPAQRDWLAANDTPVLLVDDSVDSRWTITVAARLLRGGGAAAVLPFALASVA